MLISSPSPTPRENASSSPFRLIITVVTLLPGLSPRASPHVWRQPPRPVPRSEGQPAPAMAPGRHRPLIPLAHHSKSFSRRASPPLPRNIPCARARLQRIDQSSRSRKFLQWPAKDNARERFAFCEYSGHTLRAIAPPLRPLDCPASRRSPPSSLYELSAETALLSSRSSFRAEPTWPPPFLTSAPGLCNPNKCGLGAGHEQSGVAMARPAGHGNLERQTWARASQR